MALVLAACGDASKPEASELVPPPPRTATPVALTNEVTSSPGATPEVDAGSSPAAGISATPEPGPNELVRPEHPDAGAPKPTLPAAPEDTAPAPTFTPISNASAVATSAPELPLTWPDGTPVTFDTRSSLKAVPADAADSWTLLLYVNADNPSEADALANLSDLSKLPDSAKLTILVEVDRASATATSGTRPGYTDQQLGALGEFATAKRLQVRNGKFEWLEDLGERNLGDAQLLSEFVSWGLKRSQTGHTALVLRGPGGAWRGFGPDESSSFDALTLTELSNALQTGMTAAGRTTKLDLVGFDSPLMANLETAATLSPYAERLVASEELTRNTGWDWSAFELVQKEPTSARALGQELIKRYQNHVGGMAWATLSQCDLTELPALQRALFRLQLGIDAMPLVTLGRMRNASPEVALGLHLDLIDIAQLAEETAKAEPTLQPEADAVKQAVIRMCPDPFAGAGAATSHGLSVYFPTNPQQVAAEYTDVPGMSVWQTFVKHFASQAQVKNLKPMLGESQTYFENGVAVKQADLDPSLAQQLVTLTGQVTSVAPTKAELLGNTAQLRWQGGRALQVSQGSGSVSEYVYFENRVRGESQDVSVSLFYSPNTSPSVLLQRQATYVGDTLELALDYWTLGSGYWWDVPLGSAPGKAQLTKDATGTKSAFLDLSKGQLTFEPQDVAPSGTETLILLLQDATGNRVKR